MALVFPSSPTLGQTYSSGSSATYQWNGSYWDTLNPSNITTLLAISSSFSITAATGSDLILARTASYSNDAAAAAAGVPLYGVYRSGSFVLVRTV